MPKLIIKSGITCCLIILSSALALAQPNIFKAGEVTERVTSPIDSTQQYALFLPDEYTENKKWPVIFIMDPRGRALMAMKLFRDAANELGYILVSSYNTMSDGPEQPNIDAVNAMINDVPRFFSVDSKRYYFAGFSGTAILSWPYGYQLKDNIAGVIGFGGAPRGFFLPIKVQTEGIAFSFFGGAAYHDFNYFEMLELDFKLDEYKYPHAEVFFEGLHSWPGPDIMRDALYWMELRAMKEKLRKIDTSIVNKYKLEQLEKAQKLEEKGEKYEAYRRYNIAREVCVGLADTESLEENINRLKDQRDIKQAPDQLKKHSKKAREYLTDAAEYFREVREMKKAPSPQDIMDELSLLSLMQDVQESDNEFEKRAYRVMLENIYVKVSFYEPRFFLELGRPEFSLSMLQVAEKIKPEATRNCYFQARTYAELNQIDNAFQSLDCLNKAGMLSLEILKNDTSFRKLNGDPRMIQLRKRANIC